MLTEKQRLRLIERASDDGSFPLNDDIAEALATIDNQNEEIRRLRFCARFGHPPEKITVDGICTRCGYAVLDNE